jgi:Cobinamide kinase / cobinamide phosphate guanyltransferase
MPTLTLITGGSRSGKSTHAIVFATADPAATRRYFIATAEAPDDEMRARIAHHQATRPSAFRPRSPRWWDTPMSRCSIVCRLYGRSVHSIASADWLPKTLATSNGVRSSTMFAVENANTSHPAHVNGTHGAGMLLLPSSVSSAKLLSFVFALMSLTKSVR